MTDSLFDRDLAAGRRLIAACPAILSAEHIRQLPGLEAESDAEIEQRILAGAPWLFWGYEDGRAVFFRGDVLDWWERLCTGQAVNSPVRSSRLPAATTARYFGGPLDGQFHRALVKESQSAE